MRTDKLKGGKSDKIPKSHFDKRDLREGAQHESEHTDDMDVAEKIAADHLAEDKKYYKKLKKIEAQKSVKRSGDEYDTLKDVSYGEIIKPEIPKEFRRSEDQGRIGEPRRSEDSRSIEDSRRSEEPMTDFDFNDFFKSERAEKALPVTAAINKPKKPSLPQGVMSTMGSKDKKPKFMRSLTDKEQSCLDQLGKSLVEEDNQEDVEETEHMEEGQNVAKSMLDKPYWAHPMYDGVFDNFEGSVN